MKTISDLKAELKIAKWIVFAMAAVTIFLLLKNACGGKKEEEIPVVIPTKIQKQVVFDSNYVSEKYKDSISKIISSYQIKSEKTESELAAEKMRYNDLQNGIDSLLNQPVPDTCKEITNFLSAQINKLKASNKNKDAACDAALTAKNNIISQKDALILKDKKDLDFLNNRFNISLAQQDKLNKAISSLKAKSELYTGIMVMGNETKPIQGFGVNLGLRNKKGTQYEIFAVQLNNTILYGASYKMRIAKF